MGTVGGGVVCKNKSDCNADFMDMPDMHKVVPIKERWGGFLCNAAL